MEKVTSIGIMVIGLLIVLISVILPHGILKTLTLITGIGAVIVGTYNHSASRMRND